jgi:hypothetical protein
LEGYLNGHYNTDYFSSIILPEAQPMYLAELFVDQFWMRRCATTQSLEKISDPDGVLVTRNVGSRAVCTKEFFEEFNQFRINPVGRLIVICLLQRSSLGER